MGIVRQTELFMLVAALAGMGWTLSATELWVSAQRAIPDWARGRMNAAIMMVSQGAMVLGGVIWGSLVTVVGPGSTLLGVALLFLVSLLLSSRPSANFAAWLLECASNVLSVAERSGEAAPMALSTDLSVAEC